MVGSTFEPATCISTDALQAFIAGALPVLRWEYAAPDGTMLVSPVARIDTTPTDLADRFGWMHVYTWMRSKVEARVSWKLAAVQNHMYVVLDGELSSPEKWHLTLVFDVDADREILQVAISSGRVGIASDGSDQTLWLDVPPDLPQIFAKVSALIAALTRGRDPSAGSAAA